MQDERPIVLAATTKGTLASYHLTTDEESLREGQVLFQDEAQQLIMDFEVTKGHALSDTVKLMYAVLAIGNGDVVVVSIKFNKEGPAETQVMCRKKICDIKLLSVYVANYDS